VGGLSLPQAPLPAGAGALALEPPRPANARDAAQQFEALLLAQIMRSERESGNGWLGSGGDATGESAIDFAEQQLALLLSRQGGLGLAGLISSGLEPRR
jgi:Rod binding domain-containing protein